MTDQERAERARSAPRLHQDSLLRVFDELTALGRSSDLAQERRRLWDEEHEGGAIPPDAPFWSLVEWTEERFIGYSRQLAKRGTLKQDPGEALSAVRKGRFTTDPRVAAFFALRADAYPTVCRYLRLLDYLRLLTAEHIEAFLLAPGA